MSVGDFVAGIVTALMVVVAGTAFFGHELVWLLS